MCCMFRKTFNGMMMWLIFIVACGALAISESVERKQELEKEIEDREKSHMNLYNEKKRYEEVLQEIADKTGNTIAVQALQNNREG